MAGYGPHDRRRRALLRCYPAAWRRRYGDELFDLLAEGPLTPRVVLDVAATGLNLRVRAAWRALQGETVMTIRPAWRHPTAFAVIGALLILPTFLFVAASLLSYELGFIPLRDAVAPIQAAITACPSWICSWCWRRHWPRWRPSHRCCDSAGSDGRERCRPC
jgi:hypothetical protein